MGSLSSQEVEIGVFDMKGCLIKELARGSFRAGHYTVSWNAAAERQGTASSEEFVVRMKAPNFEKRLQVVRVR
jgi:hypothetical protein